MEKKKLLVYYIQSRINYFTVKDEKKLVKQNINENIDLIKSEDFDFHNLDLCYEIIDKSDVVVVSDCCLLISKNIIQEINYALEKKIPVYAIRYMHKLKFKRVKIAMVLPKQNIGGIIVKQSGAKSKLF